MTTEVLKDVHMLEVPVGDYPDHEGVRSTLVYLIKEREGFVLVDAGWSAEPAWAALQSQVKEIGIRFTDIRWLVVTHFHLDHSGLAGKVKELSGAQLIMHPLDSLRGVVTRITEGLSEERAWLAQQGYPEGELERFFGSPRPVSRIPSLAPDLLVEGGERIGGEGAALYILWTPGHTSGHVCVYDAKRKVLFSGDHVLPRITSNISLSPFTTPNPLSDYLASLEKLHHVEAQMVLPAHEMPFTGLTRRVDELRHHHHRRLNEMHELLKDGPKTAFELARRVRWDRDPWQQPLPFSRYLALLETAAHLRFLAEEGRAHEAEKDSVTCYEAAS